jgi:hypothetical protein
MQRPWNPSSGFQALVHQLHNGIEYATYAGRPIDGEDIVDMAELLVLNRIQGKYMLENISLASTYQTLKSSGILRRNSYNTMYNAYERI